MKYRTKEVWANLTADGRTQGTWETKQEALDHRNAETAATKKIEALTTRGPALAPVAKCRSAGGCS